ncbi:hypothetical protein SPI_02125 [Niveomyces insectorum RCEF 264]|uniref:Uncharacterized protein n=1 Tax=Niveomyces insectorum RCEF 264 TaxID=1081102 RepID=A0A162KAT2_9HYPO|nr:hypothetical protein SPI_02125 [Niveomyces insectorum RCEF 264]
MHVGVLFAAVLAAVFFPRVDFHGPAASAQPPTTISSPSGFDQTSAFSAIDAAVGASSLDETTATTTTIITTTTTTAPVTATTTGSPSVGLTTAIMWVLMLAGVGAAVGGLMSGVAALKTASIRPPPPPPPPPPLLRPIHPPCTFLPRAGWS